MIKIIVYTILLIFVFTGALYLGLFELLGINISAFKSDFLSFIPIELRLGFYLIILGIIIGTTKVFVD